MSSRTRIIKNTRIERQHRGDVFVVLMMIVNDMSIVNESLREWSETTEKRRVGRKHGARAFFVRVQMADVYEALLLIEIIRKDEALKAEIAKCEDKTRACFDEVCKFFDTDDYKKLIRIRNNVGFHYDVKLAGRGLKEIADKIPDDSSKMSLGSDTLDWYFQLGDKVTDRIVVRHIFEVPEGADASEESDKIAHRIFDVAEKLAEFAGYFVWERTSL
ncbi:hypothetical protein [Bradyrhizobium niftali]|uniref:HEPN AbiU2-like domain-containing protein n=1 Tax=Bradyrhizobium niftali TaxID=2560055 RepID=A0A4Y9LZK9_9BRAD|nr:hypothetical protein [Bradyrhizobium niftali]TFV48278.1 hypothetical protein E4K65_12745 [Bradyrhizobium niftali]